MTKFPLSVLEKSIEISNKVHHELILQAKEIMKNNNNDDDNQKRKEISSVFEVYPINIKYINSQLGQILEMTATESELSSEQLRDFLDTVKKQYFNQFICK